MEGVQLSRIVNMEEPQSVLDEVKTIILMIFPDFDFTILDRVFNDVVRLFHGEYPGYSPCSTAYHDLKHTTDTFLGMARLMHGALVAGEKLTREHVNLGLVCALMHDTGYILTVDEDGGTGAQFTLIDTKRSIAFMEKYIAESGLPKKDFQNYPDIVKCTGLETRINEMEFRCQETELLCKMLGTADLLGQMADRTYLEKLLFLFYEFREGGVMGYENELDLLKKTINFYAMTRKRFASELGNVNKFMRYHFKARCNVDKDLYMETIEKNINYLRFVMDNHEKDYRDHLRRGEFVKKLNEKRYK